MIKLILLKQSKVIQSFKGSNDLQYVIPGWLDLSFLAKIKGLKTTVGEVMFDSLCLIPRSVTSREVTQCNSVSLAPEVTSQLILSKGGKFSHTNTFSSPG